MKLPKRIDVGPITFTLSLVEGLRSEDDRKLYGECRLPEQAIVLDSSQGPDLLADTLLHEVLHAAWAQTPLDESEIPEEVVIQALAPVILLALRRNPKLVAVLLH